MPKIHNLPDLVDDLEIADVLPFDDDSVADPSSPQKTKKVTVEQLRDFINSQFAIENNMLLNGNFDVWQRGTSFTQNDDLYIADRWNALQEANSSWTFARDTDVPTSGSKYSLKCSNVTLNNQCAIVQILEGADSKQFLNQNVSLSFYAKTTGTEIGNLRAAILSWSGTEDSVTSDVISAWAQNGTNPTWATNWTMENTPANLALTASWQRFTIENVAIDTANMKNIAVVIWVDDGTIAASDDFWVTQVMLNVGGTAAEFTPRKFGNELALCQRYYYAASGYGSAVNTVRAIASVYVSGNASWAGIQTPVPMRTTPTITKSGTSWSTRYGGADYVWGTPTISEMGGCVVVLSGTTTGTGNGNSGNLWISASVMLLDAEL